MSKTILIGVTGLNASGKSTVCNYLQKRGFQPLSLSDAIRQDLRERGVAETRQSLHDTGNALRAEGGAGVLGVKTMARINGAAKEGDSASLSLWAIDSIRHPAEVEALKAGSTFFTLIGVTAPTSVRFDRLVSRGRQGDVEDFAAFEANEKAELANSAAHGQQLGAVLEGADWVVENDGTVAAFEDKVGAVMADVERRLAEQGVTLPAASA